MSIDVLEADDVRAVADVVERGGLPLQFCPDCEAWTWFPRVACPSCFGGRLEWREASGEGRVLTVAVVHRTHHTDFEPHVPIALVLIELDEGCEMVSTVVGDDRLTAEIGDRVRVSPDSRWSTLPQFRLATTA